MERLDKVLAGTGRWSRREVKDLVRQGRVRIDGVTARTAEEKLDPDAAAISVDGQPVETERFTYVMLHKPAGVLSATEDSRQSTVLDLLPPELRKRGLSPVGRLDKDTEGLLLLTNDGDLLNALTHPRHEVEKHYEVRVRGNLENIPKLAEPMEIDGYSIRPATVVTIDRDEISAKLRLTIHEGRNRQIRKMCEKCGLEVRRLKRVAMGTMPLDPHLKSGAWRELTNDEIAYLQDIAADVQDGAIPHN